ncbi:hypothetical protein DL93DRAFT_2085742, partial [Clavulina sp. PMI_390]
DLHYSAMISFLSKLASSINGGSGPASNRYDSQRIQLLSVDRFIVIVMRLSNSILK